MNTLRLWGHAVNCYNEVMQAKNKPFFYPSFYANSFRL